MSVIRQDATTKAWVIIASERAKRPHDFRRAMPARASPEHEASCPFCPGHEMSTPPEVWRLSGPQGSGWAVRVIPNKFAALAGASEPQRREAGPLFCEMDGVGAHEVIIETPVHNRVMPLMTDAEIERVLQAYQARFQALRGDPRVRYIIIFKNHGEQAGTSLEHPHSQLVATPIAPLRVRCTYEVAIRHYDDTGRCLYADLVEAELEAGVRVVQETADFVVFHPFASHVLLKPGLPPSVTSPPSGRWRGMSWRPWRRCCGRRFRPFTTPWGTPISITSCTLLPSKMTRNTTTSGTSRSCRG
jgi:UDPglucose--hexose-1-phosphate uridylyltransferase